MRPLPGCTATGQRSRAAARNVVRRYRLPGPGWRGFAWGTGGDGVFQHGHRGGRFYCVPLDAAVALRRFLAMRFEVDGADQRADWVGNLGDARQ